MENLGHIRDEGQHPRQQKSVQQPHFHPRLEKKIRSWAHRARTSLLRIREAVKKWKIYRDNCGQQKIVDPFFHRKDNYQNDLIFSHYHLYNDKYDWFEDLCLYLTPSSALITFDTLLIGNRSVREQILAIRKQLSSEATEKRFIVIPVKYAEEGAESHRLVIIADLHQKDVEIYDPLGYSDEIVSLQKLASSLFPLHTVRPVKEYLTPVGPQYMTDILPGLCALHTFYYTILRLYNPDVDRPCIYSFLLKATPYDYFLDIRRVCAWIYTYMQRQLLFYYVPSLSDELQDVLGDPAGWRPSDLLPYDLEPLYPQARIRTDKEIYTGELLISHEHKCALYSKNVYPYCRDQLECQWSDVENKCKPAWLPVNYENLQKTVLMNASARQGGLTVSDLLYTAKYFGYKGSGRREDLIKYLRETLFP